MHQQLRLEFWAPGIETVAFLSRTIGTTHQLILGVQLECSTVLSAQHLAKGKFLLSGNSKRLHLGTCSTGPLCIRHSILVITVTADVLALTHPPELNGSHFADGIFRCIFVNEKVLYFDWNFNWVCSYGSNWQESSIGWDNGLAPSSG